MVVDRKKQKALALLYLGSLPLRNTTNSSFVPTEQQITDNKDEVAEGKFSNLNFCFPPKRQLSVLLNFSFTYRDLIFFLKF